MMHFKLGRQLIMISIAITGFNLVNLSKTNPANAKLKSIAVAPNQKQQFVVSLKNHDTKGLDHFIYQTVDPNSSNYRKYLSPQQFGAKYGLANQKVKVVGKYFKQHHLKTQTFNGNLVMVVSGTNRNIQKALNVKLLQRKEKMTVQQRTDRRVAIPKSIAKYVLAISGVNKNIDTRAATLTSDDNDSMDHPQNSSTNLTDQSPAKFARNYDVDALYQQGYRGQHQTIGIVTQAGFNNRDIAYFLKQQGQSDDVTRIKQYRIGNQTAGSDRMESTLDVEQASALAPEANVNAYIDDNLLAGYAAAIGRDNVDVLSISFGDFERDLALDPTNTGLLSTLELLFRQAAAQGITNFAGSGDWGAYAFPAGTKQLATFYPASSSFVTSVGGTTLPFNQLSYSDVLNLQQPGLAKYLTHDKTVSLNHEVAWSSATLLQLFGQPYLKMANREIIANLLKDPKAKKVLGQLATQLVKQTSGGNSAKQYADIVGSGGGFSQQFKTPPYQRGISGVGTYNARQLINFKTGQLNPNAKLFSGTQAGRNLPDVSGAADGLTGYAIFYNGKWLNNVSGTSIVGPQMAAAAALINEAQGQRTGFWNPQLYRFAKLKSSPFTPLNQLDNNNNYYVGQPNKLYNQATGLGTVNFAKLNQLFTK